MTGPEEEPSQAATSTMMRLSRASSVSFPEDRLNLGIYSQGEVIRQYLQYTSPSLQRTEKPDFAIPKLTKCIAHLEEGIRGKINSE